MISHFNADSALLLIDVQAGVDVLEHWGGPTGRRNNPRAEHVMGELLPTGADATLLLDADADHLEWSQGNE